MQLSTTDKTKIWQTKEKRRVGYEKKWKGSIYKALMLQTRSLANLIETQGIQARGHMSLVTHFMPIAHLLTDIHVATLIPEARIEYTRLVMMKKKYRTMGKNEKWLRDVIGFLTSHNVRLAKNITDATRNDLASVIEEGIKNGWGPRKTAQEIVSRGIITNKKRALVIARTETVRAQNIGTIMGAADSGIEVKKMWITAQDERVRTSPFSHVALEADMVELNEAFNNGEDIMQPGDPNASAANTINCRCTVALIPKEDEDGNLIPTVTPYNILDLLGDIYTGAELGAELAHELIH